MADDLVNEVQKFDLKPKAQAIIGAVKAGAGMLNSVFGGSEPPPVNPGARSTWDTPEGKMTTDKQGNPVPVTPRPTPATPGPQSMNTPTGMLTIQPLETPIHSDA